MTSGPLALMVRRHVAVEENSTSFLFSLARVPKQGPPQVYGMVVGGLHFPKVAPSVSAIILVQASLVTGPMWFWRVACGAD